MAILDNLLGGGGSSSTSADLGTLIGADPQVGVTASDVNVLGLASIGDVGVGISAPVAVGLDLSVQHDSSGGLLSGLL